MPCNTPVNTMRYGLSPTILFTMLASGGYYITPSATYCVYEDSILMVPESGSPCLTDPESVPHGGEFIFTAPE